MSVFLNVRQDGSLALFIDGDLQFDQRDERIYHEGLALPALHLECRRNPAPLKALIIGGGDGLTARELLKSSSIEKIDLVDYSAEVLDLARGELAALNQNSLANPKVNVHVEDAWQFVQAAIRNAELYDLIVVDLTVARDPIGARFHSTEWYEFLASLLGEQGILVSNGVSPTHSPNAYWSIFNSMRSAGLAALPYRVHITSFTQLGYGPDWGFMLASRTPVAAQEFDKLALVASENESAGKNPSSFSIPTRSLFNFPQGFDVLQKDSQPGTLDSTIFLKYLHNGARFAVTGTGTWSALDADLAGMTIPAGQSVRQFLPQEIRLKLADKTANIFPRGGQELLDEVMAMMPDLQPSYTRSMIAEFLSDPASFLEAVDVRSLVDKLLTRAIELPQRIVAELVQLKEKLVDWAGDYESLLDLGRRVVTTLAVIVILANFIFPDSAYGKGGHYGGHYGGMGRGGGGWNHHWGNNFGRYGGWGRPNHWHRWGYGWGYGWGGYGGWGGPYYYGAGPGYYDDNYNSPDQVPDSQGNQYPVSTYVQTYGTVQDTPWVPPADGTAGSATSDDEETAGSPSANANVVKSAFKLGPDAEVLTDGSTVVNLTDKSYLRVNSTRANLVDQPTGHTLISLYADPGLTWHLNSELKHQSAGLKKAAQAKNIGDGAEVDEENELPAEVLEAPAQSDPEDQNSVAKDKREKEETVNMLTTAKLLDKAEQNLGTISDAQPEVPAAPLEGAFELFNSAWVDKEGKFAILKRADGSLVYFDGHTWYSDQGKTKLDTQYSPKLKEAVTDYLYTLSKESASSKDSLTQDLQEAQGHLDKLKAHLTKLKEGAATGSGAGAEAAAAGHSADDLVQFGTKKIPRSDAIKRMDGLIGRAQKHVDSVQSEINNMPAESEAIKKLLNSFLS